MAIDQSKVPVAIRRRAAQHLESIRGTPMAPYAESARLGREVWPIYRPDLEEVAYYEFSVELGSRTRRLATSAAGLAALLSAERDSARLKSRRPSAGAAIVRPQAGGGQGFIVVAAAAHDFPVPHWSLDRPPVSAQLAAAAERAGGSVERITKVDSLSYVGESKDGSLVARVGQLPALLEGLPHDLARLDRGNGTLVAEPGSEIRDDDKAEGVEHQVKREADSPPELKPLEPDDWPGFRNRFADAFGPYLDDLRRQAAGAWQIDALIEEFGEGIRAGQTHRVALLEPDAVVDIGGEGTSLVKAHVDETGGSAALVIEVPEGAAIDQETDLDVSITYRDGSSERLKFFLVSDRTPSNRRTTSSEGGQ
jgi:hypothetical protein